MSTLSPTTGSLSDRPDVFADIRPDFPLLARQIEGRRIVYLDSAATSLKPRPVIEAVTQFYEWSTANIHRAAHGLAKEATEQFERARDRLARFIHADSREIILTHGATDSIQLLQQHYADARVAASLGEHHSNLVGWMANPRFQPIQITAQGTVDLNHLEELLKQGLDLVAVGHVNNVTGAVNDVAQIVPMAHRHGAAVLLDAAQSAPHLALDAHGLDVDFLVFSGHKMLGPSGVGVLYVKGDRLESLRPSRLGSQMVSSVTQEGFELQPPPLRFESGTPAIENVIGWGAAVRYLQRLDLAQVEQHGRRLAHACTERLAAIPRVSVLGGIRPENRLAIVSFTIDSLEAHGVARMLSARNNVMVRSGFHCAEPLHQALKSRPTVRASFYVYNTMQDVEQLTSDVAEIVSAVR